MFRSVFVNKNTLKVFPNRKFTHISYKMYQNKAQLLTKYYGDEKTRKI